MGNVFDKMQSVLHNTINQVFGYTVSWTPSGGGDALEALCLFNDPTKTYRLGGADFSPNLYSIDWRKGDLPGLYEASRGTENEFVFIRENGTDPATGLDYPSIEYACLRGTATWDGKIYHLVIEPVD